MAKSTAGGGGAKGRAASRSGGKSASRLGGDRQLKVRVKSSAQRTSSQTRWLERQLNDPYVAAARKDGWRSRAAYKLIEIDERRHLLKTGQRVVDLGAAPGGWSQYAARCVKSIEGRGQVIAIDYLEMEALAGVSVLQLDFLDPTAPDRLRAQLRDSGADIVLSDMAAPTTGHNSTDHLRIMGLAETAAQFACEVLVPGGVFLCKMFQGGTEKELLVMLKQHFAEVRHIKPPASRKESSELYVLATGFHGRGKGQRPAGE